LESTPIGPIGVPDGLAAAFGLRGTLLVALCSAIEFGLRPYADAGGHVTAPRTVESAGRFHLLPVSSTQAPIACAPPMPLKVVRQDQR
jgi:hypothetical protein